jgi:hypothetical protein
MQNVVKIANSGFTTVFIAKHFALMMGLMIIIISMANLHIGFLPIGDASMGFGSIVFVIVLGWK